MKFSVGEIVVYVGPAIDDLAPGQEITIDEVLPRGYMFYSNQEDGPVRCHPSIQFYKSGPFHIPENEIRKRPYKDQHTPAEQSFGELISSLKGVGV